MYIPNPVKFWICVILNLNYLWTEITSQDSECSGMRWGGDRNSVASVWHHSCRRRGNVRDSCWNEHKENQCENIRSGDRSCGRTHPRPNRVHRSVQLDSYRFWNEAKHRRFLSRGIRHSNECRVRRARILTNGCLFEQTETTRRDCEEPEKACRHTMFRMQARQNSRLLSHILANRRRQREAQARTNAQHTLVYCHAELVLR